MRGPPPWLFRALFLLAPAALVLCALIGGHGLGGADLELMFYPFWDYLGHSLRQGRLPLWDPDLGAGIPFLASLQSQALYPPATLLFTLLPLHAAAFVYLFGHFFFAGLGTERLARRLGWSAPSAVCAGALVACAPLLASSIPRPNMVPAVAWLPWTLLAADRVCQRRRGGIAALAACVGLGLLCATPEITLLGALAVGGYACWRAARGDRAALPLCLLGGLLGLALAAVVLLPFAELLGQSTRALDLRGMEGAWSFGRGDFASLFLPFLNLDAPADSFREVYYGPFQGDLAVVYLGAPALLLAAMALRRGGRLEWLLAAVAAAALLLAAYGGEATLLLERLHLAVLGWRYPVKFVYPAAFAVALLAARGAEAEAAGRGTVRALLGIGWLSVLAGIIWAQRLGTPVALSVAWVGAALVGLANILAWVPAGPWRQLALVLLCVGDASLASLRVPFAEETARCAGLFEALKPRVGQGRIDTLAWAPMPEGFASPSPGWQNRCREGNIAAEYGLPSVRYYGTPWPRGTQSAVKRFGSVGDGLLGVTLVLRGKPEPMAGLTPLPAPELAPLWAAEIPGAAPRVELRPSARVVPDVESALAQETLAQARAEVLLDDEPPPPSAPGEPTTGEDVARLVADRGEQVEIETASIAERYLVLADLHYPGWTATVDGRPAPILRAYGMVRALRLGPGRHHVLFDYRPESFRRGLWITLLTAAGLAVGTGVRRGAG